MIAISRKRSTNQPPPDNIYWQYKPPRRQEPSPLKLLRSSEKREYNFLGHDCRLWKKIVSPTLQSPATIWWARARVCVCVSFSPYTTRYVNCQSHDVVCFVYYYVANNHGFVLQLNRKSQVHFNEYDELFGPAIS